ncbi:MAG: hypothetical protein GX130_07350 [Candidatus Hydrogenedens sp.]|nr:hypothetical protein [Candidatus Hydrogenedens sp.]
MTFSELRQGEKWMTEEERKVHRRFAMTMKKFLKDHGVATSPLLIFRVSDIAMQWLVVRRLENSLFQSEDDEQGGLPTVTTALADHIGKGRERLRKAIRELEDACARLGTPIDAGLADEMAPLMRETRELMDGADFSGKEE